MIESNGMNVPCFPMRFDATMGNALNRRLIPCTRFRHSVLIWQRRCFSCTVSIAPASRCCGKPSAGPSDWRVEST